MYENVSLQIYPTTLWRRAALRSRWVVHWTSWVYFYLILVTTGIIDLPVESVLGTCSG